MTKNRHRFDKSGLLAIEPSAFFDLFFEDEKECPPFIAVGDVAIVEIDGPLDHHAGWWCDSYDEIAVRMSAAIASPAKTIVMRVNSPGGVVSGCFSMVRSVRAKAELAGKSIVAHVDGLACSAGYAIASMADRIICSETAILGSIGVIQTRVDVTKMDETYGCKFNFITSGLRKADGNPHQLFSEEERVELQAVVDAMANVFFDWTAERRGQDFRPLQAGIAVGVDAKAKGLTDDIMSFDSLLAGLASGGIDMSKYTDARAALEDAAGEDGDEADKATKVLAYMDTLESSDEEPADEEAASDAPTDEEDKDKPAASTVIEMANRIQALEDELKKSKKSSATSERDAIIASRPDLTPSLVAILKTKPAAEVRAIVDGIEKPKKVAAVKNTVVLPKATRSEGQTGNGQSALPPVESNALRQRMGLAPITNEHVDSPYKMTLSTLPKAGEGK